MSTSANGAHPSATLKRRLSTPLDTGSTPKRVKTEEEEDVSMELSGSENLRSGRRASFSGKDKRKRRHKKKKKLPIVQQDHAAASRVEPVPPGVSEKRAASSPPRSNATPGPSRTTRSSSPTPRKSVLVSQYDESVPSKDTDKGKGRAVSPQHPALQSDAASLAAHRALLGNILPSLTCQICLQLMYRPFSVVPCGHIACHSCLVNWFSNDPGALGQAPPQMTGPQAQDNAPDQAPQAGPGPRPNVPVVRRKKTCPHCRAVVRSKPVEAWSIKEMVASVVRSGLADPDAVPLELQQSGAESSNDAAADPWKHIFTSADGEGQNYDRLMEEMNMGIRDDDDGGVYRCVDCLHEIWDGHCSSCGRFYVGHRIGMDSDSEGDEIPPMWEDDDDDGEADEHIHFFRRVLGIAMRGGYPGAPVDEPSEYHSDDSSSRGTSPVHSPPTAHGSSQPYAAAGVFHWSDDGEDEEGGYESSFIDDDDDHPGDLIEIPSDDDEDDPYDHPYHADDGGARRGGRHIIISDSEHEDEDDDDLADAVANREYDLYGDDGSLPSRRLRSGHPDPIELTDDEEDDGW